MSCKQKLEMAQNLSLHHCQRNSLLWVDSICLIMVLEEARVAKPTWEQSVLGSQVWLDPQLRAEIPRQAQPRWTSQQVTHTDKNKWSLFLKTADFLGNVLFCRNSRLIPFLPHRLPNLKIVSLLHHWPHYTLYGPHLVPLLCCLKLFEIPCDSWHLCLCWVAFLQFLFFSFPLYLTCYFFQECLFFKVNLIFAFFFCCSLKVPCILSSVPFRDAVAHPGLFFCFSYALQGDGPSPSCCPFTAPPESERQMNKRTEILPLIIAFCFLAPMVYPPPAAQRWSSLITLLPGCSVFEQQEGKKERKWDGPGEGRKNHGELVNGIFVFWNEFWRKQGIRETHCVRTGK